MHQMLLWNVMQRYKKISPMIASEWVREGERKPQSVSQISANKMSFLFVGDDKKTCRQSDFFGLSHATSAT
jgi:hypothetical protein